MNQIRVGLGNAITNSRYSPTVSARADVLTATASGVDSYWVADHLNALFPRSIHLIAKPPPRAVGPGLTSDVGRARIEPATNGL